MRIFLLLILTCLSINSFSQGKQDTLTNEKLIKMVKSGLSDIIIIKSISSTKFQKFDLSSDGLIELKKNKVSDSIILILFDRINNVSNTNSNDNPLVNNQTKIINNKVINSNIEGLQPGIYYFNPQSQKYTRLSGIKSSIQIGTKFSMLNSAKWFYEFNGTSAQTKAMSSKPEFYIILGTNQSGTVFEPSRFVLINVEVKKGKRTISLDNGAFVPKSLSGPSSFSEKDGRIIPTYTEVSDNAYKITFEKKLPNGNYFFAPSQIIREASMEFFEFDIKN